MKRLIAVLILAALALVPATASAKSKTKVYRGTFTLVGGDGDYVTGNFGKAQLVDGKRNDKLSVHVRRLAKRTTYTYRLQQGTCKEGAPGGTDVPGWKYRPLKTGRKGVGNSTARSRTFTATKDAKYFAGIYSATGEMVACAQLRTKGKKPHGKADKPRGKSDDKGTKGDDKARGKSEDAPGKAEDKARGKSEDAPGKAEDKARGKSEDAPGKTDDKSRGKSDDAPRGKGRDRDNG
jgi:hypothetical protein